MNDNSDIEKINYEYYGVEYEDEGLEEYINEKPFDAEKIRIDQQMLSLKYIYDLMEEGQIDRSPSFQRNKVWTENKRKSLLIESLMLRIPIPTFYFYENENSKFIVIDGQQRLTTIRDFINNKFRLSGLEYLVDSCGNKYFKQLDIKYQQRIFRTQFAINILDARSPLNVIFDIFRRVNTGGVSLKPQEIRNAIAKESARKFLSKLSKCEEFKLATRNRIKDDRMDAQELVLRYIAFDELYRKQEGELNYQEGDLTAYLDKAMINLNSYDEYELREKEYRFKKAMNNSYNIFNKYAFRKIYLDLSGRYIEHGNVDIINKALFTSWSVVLTNEKYDNLDSNISNKILMKLAECLTDDYEYNTMLTQGTNSRRAINYNFYMAKLILEGALKND